MEMQYTNYLWNTAKTVLTEKFLPGDTYNKKSRNILNKRPNYSAESIRKLRTNRT